ncbi:MAG: hypothetical protein ACO1N9_06090 [Flavobacterium sp.]
MKTITFYVAALLCLVATKLTAQESFSERVDAISKNMETITKTQKDSLKIEVEQVNQQLQAGTINAAEADVKKQQLADMRAKKIEDGINAEQVKLEQLINDKVEGKIAASPKKGRFSFEYDKGDKNENDTLKQMSFKRTTSQFVFALGVNRLVVDDKIDHDSFEDRSDFYEWGLSFNTRMLKNNNLLHLKYGLSLQYNNLRPENNKKFATTADGQTGLVDSGLDLKVSRFRYVNLVIPVHIEFDFTPKKVNGDMTYFPSHESFRIGFGGYAGINVKEKQILKYSENDHKIRHKEKGDFNVNDFTYGLSAYVGYGQVALYAKYDLQPVFANNAVDAQNLSMGVRFDFN